MRITYISEGRPQNSTSVRPAINTLNGEPCPHCQKPDEDETYEMDEVDEMMKKEEDEADDAEKKTAQKTAIGR